MENIEIRMIISDAGIRHKDVAEEMGVTPEYFSALLRDDLSEKNWKRIVAAIARVKARRK